MFYRPDCHRDHQRHYHNSSKVFTPLQVDLIMEFLGEPGD
jgi:hypothetical protein